MATERTLRNWRTRALVAKHSYKTISGPTADLVLELSSIILKFTAEDLDRKLLERTLDYSLFIKDTKDA
jgi:hypothetical protein